VYLSLIDPPIIFCFFTKLVFRLFFENKLGNGLTHDRNRWEKIQKDRKRCKKMAKGGKRLEKMGKDGGCVGEHRFLCDVASAHVLLNHGFPYLGGSWLVSDLWFGFCF